MTKGPESPSPAEMDFRDRLDHPTLEGKKQTAQMEQPEQVGERLMDDRKSASRILENLYSNAATPDGTSSKQGLLRRINGMSPEELHFLNAALRKTVADFGKNRNQKSLEAILVGLSTQRFTKEAVKATNKSNDEQELERIRRILKPGNGASVPEAGKQASSVENNHNQVQERSVKLKPKFEKITDENFERYAGQNKEILIGSQVWRLDGIKSDGDVILHRSITIPEAVQLAERANRGELDAANVNTPNVKTKAGRISKTELKSQAQWIVEMPPRPREDANRQKEVDEANALQTRLMSGEFKSNKVGEEDLLIDVFNKSANRLSKEKQDYESSQNVL
ncbi:MAG: hypothetical protein AAB351_03730 [Patescibacteria group bacterium]